MVVGHRWVNEKLAHRWRNRKSALKTKYYESRNDEETINGLKNEVGENQWDWLVKFWEFEKGQVRAYIIYFLGLVSYLFTKVVCGR